MCGQGLKVVSMESLLLKFGPVSGGFVNIFSRRATAFDRRAKLFELNFFLRKTFS